MWQWEQKWIIKNVFLLLKNAVGRQKETL